MAVVTWEEVNAKFDRAAELAVKNEKGLEELRKTVDRASRSADRAFEAAEKAGKAVFGVKGELIGISKSNWMMTEDYFYESLYESMAFGGIHFDRIRRNIGHSKKLADGSTLDGEYDIVMYNDTAVCLVEVKYKFRGDDVKQVAKWYAATFKRLFPEYADFKIYVGVGGMAFEEGAVDIARQSGLGVLKVKGDAVVIYDEGLKAY